MLNKKNIVWLCALSLVLLSACQQNTTQNVNESSINQTTSASEVLTDEYRQVFVNNAYPISKSRGISANVGSATNVATFERGLLEISKGHFSPNQYYFLEGQFLEAKTVSGWLSVQSDDKPNGLNTTIPGQRDIIISILEQDFMLLVDGNYELNGMSIGIALNPNVNVTTTLTDADLITIGKNASVKILETLRQTNGLSQIPIVFGLYKQMDDKGVSRGAYIQSGVSTSGTTISNWASTNIVKRIYPLDADNSTESAKFIELKRNVEGFFPNLNGVVGHATFADNVLTELQINITTQFYGQSEMAGLAQFLVEQAAIYNRTGLKVTIIVESVRGTEAVIFKDTNELVFHRTILK